jgi:hypothetical protein
VFYIGREPTRVEIINDIDGVDYATCEAHAVEAKLDGIELRAIGLDELIANKRASGRLQDLADAEVLEQIRQTRDRPGDASS